MVFYMVARVLIGKVTAEFKVVAEVLLGGCYGIPGGCYGVAMRLLWYSRWLLWCC